MVVDGAVKAPDLVRFLRRLVRDARGKVFLIADRLQAHRARLTRDWLGEPSPGIEGHPPPSHHPGLVLGRSCLVVNAVLSLPPPTSAPRGLVGGGRGATLGGGALS